MNIKVINLHDRSNVPPGGFIYAGRVRQVNRHLGNPFSHIPGTLAAVRVANREAAIQAFRDWLDGTAYQDVEPERRAYILYRIEELAQIDKDLTLACFCTPLACHCDVLAERILTAHARFIEST